MFLEILFQNISDSEIKKYSDRFVYWKSPDESIYALNVVSKTDVDQFCAVANNSSTLPSTMVSQKFQCEMAPLMSARHGHVVEQENLKLSDCTIVFRPPDLIQFLDKDNNHLISTSAVSFLDKWRLVGFYKILGFCRAFCNNFIIIIFSLKLFFL